MPNGIIGNNTFTAFISASFTNDDAKQRIKQMKNGKIDVFRCLWRSDCSTLFRMLCNVVNEKLMSTS